MNLRTEVESVSKSRVIFKSKQKIERNFAFPAPRCSVHIRRPDKKRVQWWPVLTARDLGPCKSAAHLRHGSVEYHHLLSTYY
jgi:hypothetical protein